MWVTTLRLSIKDFDVSSWLPELELESAYRDRTMHAISMIRLGNGTPTPSDIPYRLMVTNLIALNYKEFPLFGARLISGW